MPANIFSGHFFLKGDIMTYNDIKQRVYDILNMSIEEAKRLGYSDKIPRIINEALFRIANSISPYIREYIFKISKINLPAKVTMPPDFISFFDDQNAYLNGNNFILTKFVGGNGIIVDGKEIDNVLIDSDVAEYTIFYNAHYPKIIKGGKFYSLISFHFNDDIPLDADNYFLEEQSTESSRLSSDTSYEISDVIAPLLPHYVVGQLLAQDDKVRSLQEINEFEILLATINVDRRERQREYRSSRGWY